MPDPLLQAIHEWQNFYLLAGTGSATLMGLLFIAVSLGTHLVSAHETGVRLFVTPTLVHLMLVLLVALVMLVPSHTLLSLAGSLLVIGISTTAYLGQLSLHLMRGADGEEVNRNHWMWHSGLPLGSYATIVGVAIWLLTGNPTALNGLAVSMGLLLIIGLHNAWDLVLWLARNR
jgi:hypothetical protein